VADFEGSISRIEKVLLEESMHNVGVAKCYTMNCYQHFFHGKILLLRQEFWSLSFENRTTYGLDFPRRLHTRGNGSRQKFLIIQGLDICKTIWCQIIGLSRSTYMFVQIR
jgi:hypothetical protein